ncbi:MAG: tRNA pseudouridine(38-40) synthase TruA [Phycisphaerales bacterium]
MPRYRLTVAYDGTDFKGWQKQHPQDSEPLRTAQGTLESCARAVMKEPLNLLGASRTDSGVHALGQTAAFTSDRALEPERLIRALNSWLPPDVLVSRVGVVDEDFNPISGAREKQYRYVIGHGGKRGAPRPLFDRPHVTFSPEVLDAGAMQAAANHLVGTHDFAAFTKLHHGRESTVRTVTSCQVSADGPHRVRIDVCGEGFLWNMVRIIAGTLHEVGRGRMDADAIPDVIASGERRAAGPTMPPEGLSLLWIRYDGDAPAADLVATVEAASGAGHDTMIDRLTAMPWAAADALCPEPAP